MASNLVARLRSRLFDGRANDWQTFHFRVQAELERLLARGKQPAVLEVGCGRGTIAPFPWDAFPKVHRIGLDPDPAGARNATLQDFRLLDPGRPWPIEDCSIDVALARYVFEHVENPGHFFSEMNRVLRPGGRFVFLTPNRLHPAMVAARLASETTKVRLLGLGGVDAADVFPCHYRLNSRAAIRAAAHAGRLGLVELVVREYAPVRYLDFFWPGFVVSLTLYCLLRGTRLERYFGASILGVVEKPSH